MVDDSYTEQPSINLRDESHMQKSKTSPTKTFKKKRGSGQSRKESKLSKKDSVKSIDVEAEKAME